MAWLKTLEHNASEGERFHQQEPGFSKIFVRSLSDAVNSPDHQVGHVMRVDGYEPWGEYVPASSAVPKQIDRARRRMEREIEIALAGPLAEAKLRRKSFAYMIANDNGCRSDWDFIVRCANDFCRSERERNELVQRLVKNVRARFRDKAVWRAVRHLAEALREQGTLTGPQALTIMRGASEGR
jgi:hypothetical protein